MTDQIQVRVRKDIPAPKEHEKLIKFLLEVEELPCSLPSYVFWPHGERRITDRALILMQAGLEHLKKLYPKEEPQRPVSGAERDSNVPERSAVPAGW